MKKLIVLALIILNRFIFALDLTELLISNNYSYREKISISYSLLYETFKQRVVIGNDIFFNQDTYMHQIHSNINVSKFRFDLRYLNNNYSNSLIFRLQYDLLRFLYIGLFAYRDNYYKLGVKEDGGSIIGVRVKIIFNKQEFFPELSYFYKFNKNSLIPRLQMLYKYKITERSTWHSGFDFIIYNNLDEALTLPSSVYIFTGLSFEIKDISIILTTGINSRNTCKKENILKEFSNYISFVLKWRIK